MAISFFKKLWKTKKGFSFVDLLAGMGVLIIAITFIASGYKYLKTIKNYTTEMHTMANIARDVMEATKSATDIYGTAKAQASNRGYPEATVYVVNNVPNALDTLNIILHSKHNKAPARVASFYQHIDYAGYSVSLGVGAYTAQELIDRGILNNDISSIKVAQGFEIMLYDDGAFGGEFRRIEQDTVNFVNIGFNDRMSSVVIRHATNDYSLSVTLLNTAKREDAKPIDMTVSFASMYEGYNFVGTPVRLGLGMYNATDLQNRGLNNDTLSGLKVDNDLEVMLYEDNFSGRSWSITANQGDLRTISADNTVSSIWVKQRVVPIYRIVAKHSGLVMDVSGISQENWAAIYQWGWWGGDNQKWRAEYLGDGSYRLVAVHSGKVLDVAGAGTGNGTQLIQHDWHGGDNQRFFIVDDGTGYCKIIAKHSNLLVDVSGVSTNYGAILHQWTWWGGDNQRWKFERLN